MLKKALSFFLAAIAAVLMGACNGKQETDRGAGSPHSSVLPPSEVVFEEVMAIGRDPEAPSEYLLGRPVAVATDELGNIYIADASTFSIKKYSPGGEYILSIGSRGRGPGELLEVYSMYLDPRGGVLLVDRRNSKVVRFSNNGEVIDTYPIDRTKMIPPSQISRTSEGGYFFLYKTGEARPGAETETAAATNMIHVVDDNMSKVQEHFVSLSSLGIGDNPHARSLAVPRSGQFCMQNDTTLLYVPGLYGGEIYVYQNNQLGTWHFSGQIEGFVEEEKAFIVLENASRDDPRVNFTSLSRKGRFSYHVNNDNRGLFVLSNGRIVHFSITQVNGERQPWIELFSEEGELIRHGPVRIKGDSEEQVGESYRVLWKDGEDKFYVLDRSKYPVIRVLRAPALMPDGVRSALVEKR